MHNFVKVRENTNNKIEHFIHKRTGLNVLFFRNGDKNLSFNISVKNLPYDNKGIPHILEHIVLSDSYEYENAFEFATNSYTNSYLNAITDKELTYYLVSSFIEEDFYSLSKIYSDCILNPKFSNKTFELESYNKKTNTGAIYAEMTDMFKDDVFFSIEVANEKFYNNHDYYKYCPYGVVEEIKKATLDDCICYYEDVYSDKNNIVAVATGDVDINRVLTILSDSITKQEQNIEKSSIKKHIINKTAKYNKNVNYGTLQSYEYTNKNEKKEIIITKIIHNNELEKYAYKIILDYLKEKCRHLGIVDFKYFDRCFNVYSYKSEKNKYYVVKEDENNFYNYLQKVKYKFKIKDYGYKNESLVIGMNIATDFLCDDIISVIDNKDVINYVEKYGYELLQKVYKSMNIEAVKKNLSLADKKIEQKNISTKTVKQNVETFIHKVASNEMFQNIVDSECFFETNNNETFVYISLQFSTSCDILKCIELIGFYSFIKSIEALNLLDIDTKIVVNGTNSRAMLYFVFIDKDLNDKPLELYFNVVSHSQFVQCLINDYNRYKVIGLNTFNELQFVNIMKSYHFSLNDVDVDARIFILGQYILNEYLLKNLRNDYNALCYNVMMFVEGDENNKVLSFYVESPTDRQRVIDTFEGITQFLSCGIDVETFNKTKNSIINELEKQYFSYGKVLIFKKNNNFCPNLGIIIEKLKKIMYNETKQFIDIVERGGYFG